MENDQTAIALLLFRVGPVLCCAPADPVQTIIAPQKLTRPPGANEARPGIFYHAENVVSVSELRHRFGVPVDQREAPGRLIITIQGDDHIAYWVDEIIEVIDTPSEGWGETPAYLPKGVFSKTLLLKEQIFLFTLFTDFHLLPESGYLEQYFDRLGDPEAFMAEDDIPQQDDSMSASDSGAQSEPSAEQTTTAQDPDDEVDSDAPVDDEVDSDAPVIEATDIEDSAALADAKATADVDAVSDDTQHETQPPESESELQAPAIEEVSSADQGNDVEQASTALTQNETESLTQAPENPADREPEIETDTAQNAETNAFLKPVPASVPESEQTNEQRVFPWKALAASLLLFITVAAVGIYSLLGTSPDEGVITETDDHEQTTTAPPAVNDRKDETDSEQQASTSASANKPVEKKAAAASHKTDSNDYSASITPDDEGVTIELHAPDEEPAIRKPLAADKNKKLSDTRKIKNGKEEIIHIVKKGDTLWSIAEHYVNNPYKYPQLARLSKIKNPDRIYPGNRVRILRRLRQDK